MKEKDGFQFPWYMIYTPVVGIIMIMWALGSLDTSSGDGSVDVLDKILQFLELNDGARVIIIVIVIALLALLFIVTKWIATNKHLKSIDAVATTAPEKLDKKVTDTGAMVREKVVEKIDSQGRDLINSISDVKCNTAELKRDTATIQQLLLNFSKPQKDASIQQGELISFIHEIYERHDRDQREITDLRTKVSQLEERNKELEKALCCRGHQQEAHGRSSVDSEPER